MPSAIIKKRAVSVILFFLLIGTVVYQFAFHEQDHLCSAEIDTQELDGKNLPPKKNNLQKFRSTTANSYSFDVSLNVENASLSGVMNLNYTNFEGMNLEQLVFHVHPQAFTNYGGGLVINDLQLTGKHLNFSDYYIVDTLLEVNLNRSLQPFENILLTIDFTTIIPQIDDRFGYSLTPFEAYYLTNWYPVLAVYDQYGWDKSPYSFLGESFYYDMANYKLTLTVPLTFKVACSLPIQTQLLGSKRTIIFEKVWIRDLAFVASPSFASSKTTWQRIEITSYYFDDPLLAYRGTLADDLGREALEIYSEAIGPYLWDSLDIVTFFGGGGMEYPGLVLISYYDYLNDSDVLEWEEVIVHEIAHQYFPFIIGTNSFLEPFIDEPFAVWASVYFLEAQNRTETAMIRTDFYYRYYEAYVDSYGDFRLASNMSYWSSVSGLYPYFPTVYYKGFVVLEMLRRYLGLDMFIQCFQAVYQTFAGANLYFTSFMSIFEETSGVDLDWFFTQWYFKKGLPRLSLTATTNDGLTVEVKITNEERDWYKLLLPLKIVTPFETLIYFIWVNGSQRELSIALTNRTEAGSVTLAENMLLLRDFYQYPVQTTIVFETFTTGAPLSIILISALFLLFWLRRGYKRFKS